MEREWYFCIKIRGWRKSLVSAGTNTTNELNGFNNSLSGTYFITGANGTIITSADNGDNWEMITSPSNNDLYSTSFLTGQIAYIVGDDGTILHSNDSGNTWILEASPTTSRLVDISFSDSGIGIAVGREGTIIRMESTITAYLELVDIEASLSPNPVSKTGYLFIPNLATNPMSFNVYNLLGENVLSLEQIENVKRQPLIFHQSKMDCIYIQFKLTIE
ncbi:MAG: YCF48-related protein [Bacteroidales bacterium]